MHQQPVYHIIVNRRSGTVLKATELAVETHLRATFGTSASITFADGAEIAPLVRDWLDGADCARDTLIVGGGDGTLLAAAEQAMNSGVALGVLPLGTQNFVARELGFSPDYRVAAKQYKNSVVRPMDVCSVNGHNFLYGFLVGDAPMSLFAARGSMRNGDKGEALRHVFNFMAAMGGQPQRMDVILDGDSTVRMSGRIFGATSNGFRPRSNMDFDMLRSGRESLLQFFGNAFARTEENDGRLGFYNYNAGLWGVARMFPRLWDGTWNEHKGITTLRSPSFTISPAGFTRDDSAGVNLVLDGELVAETFPLEVRIHPRSLLMHRAAPLSYNS